MRKCGRSAGAPDGDTQIQQAGPLEKIMESYGFAEVAFHASVVSTIQKFFRGFVDQGNEANHLFGEGPLACEEDIQDGLVRAGEEIEQEHERKIFAGLENFAEVQFGWDDVNGIEKFCVVEDLFDVFCGFIAARPNPD
jgi:hypothetical protein